MDPLPIILIIPLFIRISILLLVAFIILMRITPEIMAIEIGTVAVGIEEVGIEVVGTAAVGTEAVGTAVEAGIIAKK